MRYAAFLALFAAPLAAEPAFTIDAEHSGFREYYCVTKGTITNTGTAPLREINGYFIIFENGEETARSRGTSFLNLEPGQSVEALSEAPQAPCDTATSYTFIVNACMEGNSFMDRAECAAMIAPAGRVETVIPRPWVRPRVGMAA
ncbi:MAG: hypothetical protein AAGF13_00185 [Pseudomonadota bacterium]